jgi:ankyrin repeat protein
LQFAIFYDPTEPFEDWRDAKAHLDKLDQITGLADLDKAYDEIYKRRSRHENQKKNFIRALQLVLGVEKPITVDMLAAAVSVGDDKQVQSNVKREYILKITNNFVIADKHDVVQFAHLSVKEYLQNPEMQHSEFDNATANVGTATSCVSYLLSQKMVFGTNRLMNLKTFSGYVLYYWPIHAEKVGEIGRQGTNLGKLFFELFSPENRGVLDNWAREQYMLWDLIDHEILYWGLGECFRTQWHFSMGRLWWKADQHSPFLYQSETSKYPPVAHPFLLACAWGFSEIVTEMLKDGNADEYLRLKNDLGATGLIIAARFGHTKTVELLRLAGADDMVTDKYAGGNAAVWAAQAGHDSVVKALLADEKDPRSMMRHVRQEARKIFERGVNPLH